MDKSVIQVNKEKVEEETELELEKQKLIKEKLRTSHQILDAANIERKTAEAKKRAAEAKAQAITVESQAEKKSIDGKWNSKVDWAIRWLKVAFISLSLLFFAIALCLLLYYLFRLVTEEPIVKTVTETVTETVEKQVIPEECTQVRRNGKINISCDGVTVQGVPTLGDSGVDEIPELIEE